MDRKPTLSRAKPRTRFRFTIGQNRTGSWLVFDKLGLVGGLFVDRDAALRFAKTQNDGHTEEIRSLSGGDRLELGDIFNGRKMARHLS